MTADVWLKRYYELCDAKDIDGCMEFWAPDGSLRFGNAEPAFGAHAIRAACEGQRFLDQRTFVDLTPVFAPATSSSSRSRR